MQNAISTNLVKIESTVSISSYRFVISLLHTAFRGHFERGLEVLRTLLAAARSSLCPNFRAGAVPKGPVQFMSAVSELAPIMFLLLGSHLPRVLIAIQKRERLSSLFDYGQQRRLSRTNFKVMNVNENNHA